MFEVARSTAFRGGSFRCASIVLARVRVAIVVNLHSPCKRCIRGEDRGSDESEKFSFAVAIHQGWAQWPVSFQHQIRQCLWFRGHGLKGTTDILRDYRGNLDGSDKKAILFAEGNLSGNAYVELPG
jgi:hypothetical protein